MDTGKFNPAFCTEDRFSDKLNSNKKPKVDKVKKWCKPPHDTSPWDDDCYTEGNECDEVVDHLFVEKMAVDFVNKVGGDSENRDELKY